MATDIILEVPNMFVSELKNAESKLCIRSYLVFVMTFFGLKPGWIKEFADQVQKEKSGF